MKTFAKFRFIFPLFLCFTFALAAPAATLTVNSTGDASDGAPGDGVCDAGGVCTFRAALEEANALGDPDTIVFNIPGAGVHTLTPFSAYPNIVSPVRIDGYTQPGANPNTNPTNAGSNAVILIEIDGTNAGAGVDGLRLLGGGSTVRGLCINRFTDDGIAVNDGDGNIIAGNFIGTDPTGMIARGNRGDGFVTDTAVITVNSVNNTIGGTAPADRNVVSGNGDSGIQVFFSGFNRIEGNIVGLAADGLTDLGNSDDGIVINFGTSNTIGGGDPAARNIVSGNNLSGILLQGGSGAAHVVRGNYVGTDSGGTLDVGNGLAGITFNLRGFDIIGGPNPGEGNLISGNGTHGIAVNNANSLQIDGNLIGTQADGTTPLGNGQHGILIGTGTNSLIGLAAANTIANNGGDGVFATNGSGNQLRRNAIYANGGLGLDLGADGVTANDAADADTGANTLQNFPVLISSNNTGAAVSFSGIFNSIANRAYTIDFYAVATCDASGHGEGQVFLGSIVVTTDGTGNAVFNPTLAAAVPLGYRFTATATDPDGNTSEFSSCALVPTAAGVAVGGRVVDVDGRGVARSLITLTDASGGIRQTTTNAFGYYRFNDVPAGAVYTIAGRHKAFSIVPQVVYLADAREDLELEAR